MPSIVMVGLDPTISFKISAGCSAATHSAPLPARDGRVEPGHDGEAR